MLEMEVFYMPVTTTRLDFIFSLSKDGFTSVYFQGSVSLALIFQENASAQDAVRKVGLDKWVELLAQAGKAEAVQVEDVALIPLMLVRAMPAEGVL